MLACYNEGRLNVDKLEELTMVLINGGNSYVIAFGLEVIVLAFVVNRGWTSFEVIGLRLVLGLLSLAAFIGIWAYFSRPKRAFA